MREISPAQGLTAAQFFAGLPGPLREIVQRIREQKAAGTRPPPSARLVDRSTLLTPEHRRALVDRLAALVDENLTGRSEMCFQFAHLLQQGLAHLGLPARAVVGTATYTVDGRTVFEWRHAWVRVGNEVIDGNVDSIPENPLVPPTVNVAPYWGPIDETPPDRKLREHHGEELARFGPSWARRSEHRGHPDRAIVVTDIGIVTTGMGPRGHPAGRASSSRRMAGA